MDDLWSPAERAGVEHALRYAIVGTPDAVQQRLDAFVAETRVDEVMITAQIYDHAARLRSYEIVADVGALRT